MPSGGQLFKADTIANEQQYVSMLHDKLDDLRTRAMRRRDEVLKQSGGTPQAQMLREDVAGKYTKDMAKLSAVDNGLCFGRLDLTNGDKRYIGRVGIFDHDHSPLLIDWRADAAQQFYLATAANPGNVKRRRHIHTVRHTVTNVNDELLDLDAPRESWREEVTGEAALLAALNADRTGRMRDIVHTIQSEQDRIIRSPLEGVLVVHGGPGTGKTAVALHRAAYLLYQYRERLANRGVLVVGPNATFLKYIGEVLPGLAETDVLLRTMSNMYPGVDADREESDAAAVIKGKLSMVDVMTAAVADRQRVPEEQLTMDTEYGTLVLDREVCQAARRRARYSGKQHNPARPIFDSAVLEELSQQVAERIGADPLGGENLLEAGDIAQIETELRGEPEVQAVLDWLWPLLSSQQLLAGLLGYRARIANAAPELSSQERDCLLREPRSGWTASDVPLLDEAAELLGEADDGAARKLAETKRAERMVYAQGVLDIVQGSRSIDLEDEDDPEILMATDMLDAALLGERQVDLGYQSTAERAAEDRQWTFGHVIVDEAQELSAMAWRMIMRRSASRSMTVVGDLAQAGSPAAPTSWAAVLDDYATNRWRSEELSVSYRTPQEIMALAEVELTKIDDSLRVPRAVRSTGIEPWQVLVDASQLTEQLNRLLDHEVQAIAEGRVGVIAASSQIEQVHGILGAGPYSNDLNSQVSVLSVRQAKGLEFDSVIVVDSDAIVADSSHGRNDLYVALTRATRRLGVLRIE